MFRKNTIAILLAACCTVLSIAPAHAVTWGGEVFGAFNTYSMKDWNDLIDTANQSGANADNISNGFGGGLGLRVWPSNTWMISGTWEPMFASTEDKVSGDKIKLNGNSIQGTVAYFFPTTAKARYGLGAGLGAYMLGGEATSTSSPTVDLKGTGIGFHFVGMGEWEVSPGFGITGTAGYRVANVSDTEFNGQSPSPKFETDYSGLILRAGMVFMMPSSGSSK